jgi:hypothetical protein
VDLDLTVQRELVPHEDDVARSGVLDPGLLRTLRNNAIRAGLYAANMPEDVGGGSLDTMTWMLMEREPGHTMMRCRCRRGASGARRGTGWTGVGDDRPRRSHGQAAAPGARRAGAGEVVRATTEAAAS